ncbi:MAG: dTDP-4-dehydrorhamnose 3,5-epimerase [Alphaproteobacteria bacterium]|nr:dTDP-4-dehydrorhamnose 3,5-epimerase [Alphaproteobacteria bacterium]
MQVTPQELPEVLEIAPRKFGDARGFFSETYNAMKFADAGILSVFVQDNHSFSATRGVLRGLHYQLPPFAQDKLVRVTKGAIFDVAVDIRQGSPTFAKWCARIITSQAWNQLFIPKGFAHGFLTLEPDTEVIYKVSNIYAPEYECSIHYSDPELAIDWPLDQIEPLLSAKDSVAPLLKDQPDLFLYAGKGTNP